ncbi:MAG: phosphotransferase [Cellvibrionaceae bacterium]
MQADVVRPLSQWLAEVMPAAQGGQIALHPLAGDAGARRYFRIESQPDRLAVYAPPASEDSETFVALADYLRRQGVNAPRVHAADYTRGFLLIENFGDCLLLGELSAVSVEALYGEALLTLLRLQQSASPALRLPDYSRAELLREMELFPHWFIEQLLGYQLKPAEQQLVTQLFDIVLDSALDQPACFVHRDFHSRNLINQPIGPPGVIDFQDAVWGPFTYDLVSLLRDCYVRWPREDVERWALAYASMAREVGVVPATMSAEQFLRWFDLMGVQRHLKVLGVFARLALRDHKSNYLHDLPLVMRYLVEVAEQYPPLNQFATWFEERLLPLASEQSWYTDYRTAGYTPA